jgi:hypothetical protein
MFVYTRPSSSHLLPSLPLTIRWLSNCRLELHHAFVSISCRPHRVEHRHAALSTSGFAWRACGPITHQYLALPHGCAESGNVTRILPNIRLRLGTFIVFTHKRWVQVAGEAVGYMAVLQSIRHGQLPAAAI